MYILVRRDLPPAYQAVQASHAAILAARDSLIGGEHPSLVVCGVADESALREAARRIQQCGIDCVTFFEDDVSGYTALCTRSVTKEERKTFRPFKLL